MKKSQKLTDEMRQFKNEKKWYGIVLISLGFIGLVLPIMPGWLLIAAGIALISPKFGERMLEKIKSIFGAKAKF
jgi:uncharacterized membrane protein YbaN (DUF454 family)